ncbi:hypothetical protein C0Q70_13004 [Pomacea canaliculata]|uniref:EF-hand domain-containing protein n=1 Tax=Pomacea canaliculata TaxID=400727 RepID=A0A2T7P331_POMCA|nr:hypothetical protein C0Q70_13004 [Pomacea canaliculata]
MVNSFRENSNSEDFFSIMDHDGDGALEQYELHADFYKKDINGFKETHGISESLEFNMGAFIYYDKLDGNEDGVIDQSAFPFVMKMMDSDGDGEISREENERNIQKIWNGVAKESKSVLNP